MAISTAVKRVAYHEITPGNITTGDFDAEQYSLFKYGDVQATSAYAQLVAQRLLSLFSAETLLQDVILSSSAYVYMPTAATLLTEQVKQHLDSALISEASATNTSNSTTRTLQPSGIRMLKIQRAAPTQGDYSTMTVEQRAAVMGGNQLTLPPTCELAGKHLVIIDDSRITGSHEQCIERATEGLPLASLTFFYLVMVPPSLVASSNPSDKAFVAAVEDQINHAHIKDLADLTTLVQQGRVTTLTARTAKFVLQQAFDESAQPFLEQLTPELAEQLVAGAVLDGYSTMPRYADKFARIATLLLKMYISRVTASHAPLLSQSSVRAAAVGA